MKQEHMPWPVAGALTGAGIWAATEGLVGWAVLFGLLALLVLAASGQARAMGSRSPKRRR